MMTEVDFETFHASFDDYLDRVENGETFLIRLEDGRGVVCAPAGDIEHGSFEEEFLDD